MRDLPHALAGEIGAPNLFVDRKRETASLLDRAAIEVRLFAREAGQE